ncbi:hypothetical protein BH24ACT20_BH24ACT20_09310 [soil metagenome]|jgi:hypothetical protein
MAEAPDHNKYSDLFRVIEDYAGREYDYQDKALQVIAGAYVFMFEPEDMPDARPIVDNILGQYDYVFTNLERGNLDPLSVDAVVRVALYTDEYMEWGVNRLGKILEGLLRRSQTDESYEDYVEDARVVLRGLETIVTGSFLEELVEGQERREQPLN